jgi:hypothetical protein
MDPAGAPGEKLQLTELDLQAFDAIGWNRVSEPVPEPGTIGGSICAGLTLTRFLKRRHCYGRKQASQK